MRCGCRDWSHALRAAMIGHTQPWVELRGPTLHSPALHNILGSEEVSNQVYTRRLPCDWSSRRYIPAGSPVIGPAHQTLTPIMLTCTAPRLRPAISAARASMSVLCRTTMAPNSSTPASKHARTRAAE
eukprot:1179024-Prorocentrum_minimum.AAC.1